VLRVEEEAKKKPTRSRQQTDLLFPSLSTWLSLYLASRLLPASFWLILRPEDGGDMFLGNAGRLSTGYTALYPRKYNSYTNLGLGTRWR
jgi:hypothetical protein